jgi:uncharacterized membrane protein
MENSQFTSTFFDVYYYPDNSTAVFNVDGSSSLTGKIKAHFELIVYGLSVYQDSIDLCSLNQPTLCPITSGHINVEGSYTINTDLTKNIPGIAYTIPDLDAYVKVLVYSTDDTNDQTPLACLKAEVKNGKTVQTRYAGWPIACISGFGLVVSSFVSILGHSATASHIASNAASLFIYFQNLAIMAMMGVSRVPPIAASWAQNFMWSLGIIEVDFMQDIIYWYVQSTGGQVSSVLSNKEIISISVQKLKHLVKRAITATSASDDTTTDTEAYYTDEYNLSSKTLVLRGIQRVAFLANIEISNLFMTGIIFFLFIGFVLICLISTFRGICEILIRSGAIKNHRFSYFRSHWHLIIKGSLYRYFDITFSTVVLLCIWEFTQNNSSGCLAFAVIIFVFALVLMGVATIRIFLEGLKSINQFKNPAYLLFGNDQFYFKYGFLYAQYLAKRYYWVLFNFVYLFIRALLIAALQNSGKICACLIFAIEIIHTIVIIVFRPYMDKRTNIFNIFIAVINLVNSIFFMFYSNVFGQPPVVSSVAAVVYFILNAIFALVLLIFTIVTCTIALLHKNPDVRYQQVKDDRAAFMTFENTQNGNGEDMELSALGASAMQGQDKNAFFNNQDNSIEKNKISPYEMNNIDSKAHLEPYNPDYSKDSILNIPNRLNPFEARDDEISYHSNSTSTSYDRENPFSNNQRYHI